MLPSLSSWHVDSLQGLPCRVLLPEPYEPDRHRYPLILSLHGSGERGDDNVSQLKNGPGAMAMPEFRRRHPCIVVAPQAPRGHTFGGSWYGGRTPLQDTLIALLEELTARRSVDADRVYGVGFSMGAIGLWDLARRRRDLFAAIVPIAGDVDVTDTIVEELAGLPVWAVCGHADTLVPPDNTRALLARLAPQGDARFAELRDAGHDVWRPAFGHAPLWDWLFAQRRRRPAPESVPPGDHG
jgi:predicted peptidase